MIAIPNMEKPKRCLECWSGLSIDINCEAGAGFWNPNGDLIPPDCPIIEIDQEDEEAVLTLALMRKAMREGKSLREFLDGERRNDGSSNMDNSDC